MCNTCDFLVNLGKEYSPVGTEFNYCNKFMKTLDELKNDCVHS